MKKLKRLTLRREAIAKLGQQNLSNLEGGHTALTVCDNPATETVACLTRRNCDISTVDHDDGPNCLSEDDSWCWCYDT